MIVPTALLVIILFMDVTLAVEKQVKLEDIERDYLRAKQAQKQQQQQQVKPQQPARDPEYTGNQQLNYPVQQQVQAYQPQVQAYQPQVQFQSPPTAGAVALYLTSNGLPGDYLGIVPHVSYIPPQHQSIPIEPQQFYLHPGGYSSFQFVQVPPMPLIYSNQPATAPGPPRVVHSSTQKEAPILSSQANTPPQHDLRVSQLAYQQQPPVAASAVYTLQQGYNPIPKELQGYTTIPAAVYQGKEPDFLYDQQPSVSLTNDGINSYNALQQQQSKPQRPVFSSGVKSNGSGSHKTLTSGGSFLFPTRHFPSPGISYRQGPGPF